MTPSNKLKIIENYTTRSFVLTGDTKPHKVTLKNMYGKYNPHLKCGPGWVFSNKRLLQVSKFIENEKTTEKSNILVEETSDTDNSDSEWLPEDNQTDDESCTESYESEYDCCVIDNLKTRVKDLEVSNNKLFKDLNKKDTKIKKLKSKICKLKASLLRRRNIEKLEVKHPKSVDNLWINKYKFFILLMFIGIIIVNYFNIDTIDNIECFKEKMFDKFEYIYNNFNSTTYRNFNYTDLYHNNLYQ